MAFDRPTARTLRPLALASLLTLAACSGEPQQGMQGMKVPVSVVQVQPQAAVIHTELPGRVQAIEDAEIRARVNGIVQSIDFEQGSTVKAGQLLFTIDPAPYRAARDQAAAQLKNAQASQGKLQPAALKPLGGDPASPLGAELLYRSAVQRSADGNTVDIDVERAQFAENAVRYEAQVMFVSSQIKSMLAAIQG